MFNKIILVFYAMVVGQREILYLLFFVSKAYKDLRDILKLYSFGGSNVYSFTKLKVLMYCCFFFQEFSVYFIFFIKS